MSNKAVRIVEEYDACLSELRDVSNRLRDEINVTQNEFEVLAERNKAFLASLNIIDTTERSSVVEQGDAENRIFCDSLEKAIEIIGLSPEKEAVYLSDNKHACYVRSLPEGDMTCELIKYSQRNESFADKTDDSLSWKAETLQLEILMRSLQDFKLHEMMLLQEEHKELLNKQQRKRSKRHRALERNAQNYEAKINSVFARINEVSEYRKEKEGLKKSMIERIKGLENQLQIWKEAYGKASWRKYVASAVVYALQS